MFSWDTPAVVVDGDRLERNIRDMAELAANHGKRLRPMFKTHKSLEIAARQAAAGAVGFLAAKLGEAEVLAAAGFTDVTLAYPLLGEAKYQRLQALVETAGARVTLSFDSREPGQRLGGWLAERGHCLPFLVIVEVGLGRLGVTAGRPAAELAASLQAEPGLEFVGFASHSGHAYGASSPQALAEIARREAGLMAETVAAARALGLVPKTVAVGSTPTVRYSALLEGITELRPGNYVFNDFTQVALGVVPEEDCALTIRATVLSRPATDRAVIDAGSKTLSSDLGPHSSPLIKGYGRIIGHPGAVIERVSEEVGIVRLPVDSPLAPGDVITIIPNHSCSVANLHDRLLMVREGRSDGELTVAARGRVR